MKGLLLCIVAVACLAFASVVEAGHGNQNFGAGGCNQGNFGFNGGYGVQQFQVQQFAVPVYQQQFAVQQFAVPAYGNFGFANHGGGFNRGFGRGFGGQQVIVNNRGFGNGFNRGFNRGFGNGGGGNVIINQRRGLFGGRQQIIIGR